MDGDRHSKILAFADWQRHEEWPPLDETAYRLYARGKQEADKSDRMHRRIIWACVVFLLAWCWGLFLVRL